MFTEPVNWAQHQEVMLAVHTWLPSDTYTQQPDRKPIHGNNIYLFFSFKNNHFHVLDLRTMIYATCGQGVHGIEATTQPA